MRISPLGIDAGQYGQSFTEAELTAFRQRHDLEPGYVGQVGRIERKKNQLAVIQALYNDPLPLVFVGKDSPYYAPDYPDRCRELARATGTMCDSWAGCPRRSCRCSMPPVRRTSGQLGGIAGPVQPGSRRVGHSGDHHQHLRYAGDSGRTG